VHTSEVGVLFQAIYGSFFLFAGSGYTSLFDADGKVQCYRYGLSREQ
jgi:hypothetical protein